ncbi:hypothetical protein QAD02_020116 [Eretmocerus hayati]|uniref:Uncharacterized protein n=1 Tax=Eretmocerus hayati TaxID=131215 RepID=A0ACC2PL74_9HYME|nr:hypothetical protein QAD02_020116 [Eretmocerus hayati]
MQSIILKRKGGDMMDSRKFRGRGLGAGEEEGDPDEEDELDEVKDESEELEEGEDPDEEDELDEVEIEGPASASGAVDDGGLDVAAGRGGIRAGAWIPEAGSSAELLSLTQ